MRRGQVRGVGGGILEGFVERNLAAFSGSRLSSSIMQPGSGAGAGAHRRQSLLQILLTAGRGLELNIEHNLICHRFCTSV